MMNIRNNHYLFFFTSLLLFLIVIGFTAYIYMKWDEPAENHAYEVEVNLPIIDWQRYLGLSKQY